MAEAMKTCDFCPFLKMQEFEAASDIRVKVDVTKGNLISWSISLWLKFQKMMPLKHKPEHLVFKWLVLTAQGCDFAPFYGDFSQF